MTPPSDGIRTPPCPTGPCGSRTPSGAFTRGGCVVLPADRSGGFRFPARAGRDGGSARRGASGAGVLGTSGEELRGARGPSAPPGPGASTCGRGLDGRGSGAGGRGAGRDLGDGWSMFGFGRVAAGSTGPGPRVVWGARGASVVGRGRVCVRVSGASNISAWSRVRGWRIGVRALPGASRVGRVARAASKVTGLRRRLRGASAVGAAARVVGTSGAAVGRNVRSGARRGRARFGASNVGRARLGASAVGVLARPASSGARPEFIGTRSGRRTRGGSTSTPRGPPTRGRVAWAVSSVGRVACGVLTPGRVLRAASMLVFGAVRRTPSTGCWFRI